MSQDTRQPEREPAGKADQTADEEEALRRLREAARILAHGAIRAAMAAHRTPSD